MIEREQQVLAEAATAAATQAKDSVAGEIAGAVHPESTDYSPQHKWL